MMIQVNTTSDVESMIDELFKMQKTGGYVFRGISKNREIQPSLFRFYEQNKIEKTGKDILLYEMWLLEEYGKYSTQYLPSFFTPLDWVASAQHFGLPTRLIDWTFNPFCALFFSLFNPNLEEDDSYRLLVINLSSHLYTDDVPIFERDCTNRYDSNNYFVGSYTNFVNGLANLSFEFSREYGYNTRKTKFTQMLETATNKEYEDASKHHLFFCSIYNSNPRIIAQNGLFQIPRNMFRNQENGDYYHDKLTIDGCEKIYRISKDKRGTIRELLKKLDITTPRLFPDLQNICEYLKREIPTTRV
jgi:hypothetical protein